MANAGSGMNSADDCKLKFMELKRKKTYRYIIFKIENDNVVVEKTGLPGSTYEEFSKSLPENDCRYGVFDFDFTTEDNCHKSKIFFIAWSPEVARVRSKMTYASTRETFRRELHGIHFELQATDATEMDIEVIKDRANK